MNPFTKKRTAALIALVAPLAAHAAPIVDWLAFGPGADRTHFNLLNDAGLSVAQAQIDLTSGLLAPPSPGAGTLQAAFWNTAPPVTDSISNDGNVSTTKVQVVPQAGAVDFQLTIGAQDLSGMVFAVGQLFGSGTAGTRGMGVLARTFSGVAVALELLGTEQWDNGIRAYTQPLNWNGSSLTLDAAANGESAFAFFRVQPGAGRVTQLVFDIPNGYAVGSGDTLEFAFGVAVPEPGVAAMLILGFGFTFSRRTRA